MKNKFLYIFLLLGLLGQDLSAADVGAGTRTEIGRTLTRIVSREVAGGYVKVQGVDASAKRVKIYTSIGLSYYPFREDNLQAMRDSVRQLLPQEYRKAGIELYSDTREVSELIPMAYRTGAEFRKLVQKKKIIPFTNRSARPLVTRLSSAASATQGLAGRHIALWQSHGRYFDQPQNRWKWQRSMLWQTCEDLYTQSYVLPYLVPMLENAGANVLLPRERDVQKIELLLDNDAQGQYREQNGPQKWQAGGMGFAHTQRVYRTGENPFRHGTTRRVRTVTGGAESSAVWSADIPQAGEYAVYVSYDSTPESADDAQYTVHHLGGDFNYSVNQTMGGGTWIYLGRFAFASGAQDVVTLSNRSHKAGRIVSADAVKIGGGYGNIARTPCDSLRLPDVEYREETSGYPRFCEGARYWLQWAGFDEKVYTPKENKDDYKDDYMSRAHWVNALMGGSERLRDSVGLGIPVDMALAFHSDAGVRLNDDIIGTLGIYCTKENKGRFAGGADRYRSRDLTDIVMTQIVGDIRNTYEPDWTRRGLWNRAYYEARVPSAPTMLLELLSHQNFADMRYGSDPRFKFMVSRAIYKGILRYISSQYQLPYVIQPLPVEALATEFADGGNVKISWSPVMDPLEASAAPTGYVVYTRIDDGGFDNGRYVDKPVLITAQEPDKLYSYKVTAVNEGGESFPSEVAAACRVSDEKGRVLVVNGFDRISAPLSMRRDSLAGFYNSIDAGVPDKQDISFIGEQYVFDMSMAKCDVDSIALGACYSDFETEVVGGNTFDYAAVHGRAIANSGYSFCSASVRSVTRDEVSLEVYPAIDLILGEQRSTTIGRGVADFEFKTFPAELQDALRRYVAG
ncbi:xanthan lyase, partial [uncultured Alistipes sp.]